MTSTAWSIVPSTHCKGGFGGGGGVSRSARPGSGSSGRISPRPRSVTPAQLLSDSTTFPSLTTNLKGCGASGYRYRCSVDPAAASPSRLHSRCFLCFRILTTTTTRSAANALATLDNASARSGGPLRFRCRYINRILLSRPVGGCAEAFVRSRSLHCPGLSRYVS